MASAPVSFWFGHTETESTPEESHIQLMEIKAHLVRVVTTATVSHLLCNTERCLTHHYSSLVLVTETGE